MGVPESLLCVPLEIPARGEACRVEKGCWQVVVERCRGGVALVAHDGRASRRWLLGLPKGGALELRAGAPRYPVRVRLEDALALVPGGRLRGYVAVPLPHEVVWRGGVGEVLTLVELVPPGLRTAWRGEVGYEHEVASRFALDLGRPAGEARAMVPVVLRNVGSRPVSPGEVVLQLRQPELRVLRGRIVAAPRSLSFAGDEVVASVHGFLGERA